MADNSYEDIVIKAKSAIGQISFQVNELDIKLKSVVKTLTDYQKVEMPSKVTAQLKAQADAMKKLEGTVVDLKQKLEQKAQAETKLAGITRRHTEESMRATIENQKYNAELKKTIQGATETANAIEKLTASEKEETAVIKEKIPSLKQLAILGKEETMALNNITNAYQQLQAKEKQELELIRNLTAELRKLDEEGKKETDIYHQKTQQLNTISEKYKQTTDKINEVDASVKKLTESEKQNANAGSKVASAYNDLNDRLRQAKDAYMSVIVAGRRVNESTKDYNQRLIQAKNHFQNLTNQANAAQKAVSNFGNTSLGGLVQSARSLMSAFGVIGGVTLFATMVKDAFGLIRTLDSISFSMKAVITDSRELGQTEVWLKDITESFGAELVTTTNRYIKFRAAAAQANFTAEETQAIFGTMTKAAGVLGLKTDELQGIYLALEQMISKGKITTEELRRQLGERLPGAMDIMAKSMGKTTAELDKMLKAGEVITKDVLPGFAEQVEIAFGLDSLDRVDTLQAATMRLQNAWTLLVQDFSEGNNTTADLRTGINFLAENLGMILKTIGAVVIAFLTYKTALVLVNSELLLNARYGLLVVQSTIKTTIATIKDTVAKIAHIAATKGVAVATGYATAAMWAFTRSLLVNPIFLTVAALGALYLAFSKGTKSVQELTEEFIKNKEEALKTSDAYNQVTDNVEALYERYKTLAVNTNRSTEEQIEFEKIIAKIGGILPGTVTKVDQYTKATELNTKAVEDNIAARNIETGNKAATDAIETQKELEKSKKAYEEYQKSVNNAKTVEVDFNGETIKLIKLKSGAIKNIDGKIRDANEFEIKAFNQKDAQMQREISQLENVLQANQLLAFNTQGFFEEETAAHREKQKQKDDEAKALQEEFDNMTVKESMQKDINDAEINRNKSLGLNAEEMSKLKIDNEEAYVAKVKQAIDDVKNYNKEAYETAKKNLEESQKDYDEFFDKKGEKKADAANNLAEREAERLLKAKLKFDQEALKSSHDTRQANLKEVIDNNQAILDDELGNVIRKIQAGQDLEKASNESALAKAKFEIAMATLSTQFIIDSSKTTTEEKEIAADLLVQKTKEINDELLAIENANAIKGKENTKKTFEDEFKLKQKQFEQIKALEESKFNEEKLQPAQKKYEDDLKALNEQLKNKEISQSNFDARFKEITQQNEDEIQRIKRESAINQLKTQIALWRELIEKNPTLNEDERKTALATLAEYEKNISDATLENELANMQTEEEARQRLYDMRKELIDKATTSIAEALNLDAKNLSTLFLDIADGFGTTTDEILQTIANVSAVVGDIVGSVHERNIEQLDEEIQANSDYYAAILANEELSEEQRSAIEAQRDAKEAILEKKKREEKTKAAKAEKVAAIAQATISTALAILSALQTKPFLPLGPAMAILAGSIGAVQIASIVATPIPKFERGTQNAPGGWAMVDERVPEIHTDANDNIKSKGYNKPNLRYLSKGDKIYKSKEEFLNKMAIQDINRTAWELNMESNGKMITQVQVDTALMQQISGLRGDMDTMGRRIEKMANRPININNKVVIDDKRPY